MDGANKSTIQLFYDQRTGKLQTRVGDGTGAYGTPILVDNNFFN